MDLDPTQPATYPRRILLAVTGMSPQIVTETVYALAVKAAPGVPFVPTEIHLITTGTGRTQAINNLLSEQPGWFHRLRKDYGLPEIHFDHDCIHVVKDVQGRALDDIRTPDDNERIADFITEHVRELTRDGQAALHASLAGGRKTMGFYLGYALSLFARPQDRLSHVLVGPPLESSPGFYYPTPYESILQIGERPAISADARLAEISLAQIPVVSLRHGLPQDLLDGRATFNGAVRAARDRLAPPGPVELIVDPGTGRVSAGRVVFRPSPTQFALLAVLAYRTMLQREPLYAPTKDVADLSWSHEFLSDLRAACREWNISPDLEEKLRKGVDGDFFSQHLSRLQNCLSEELGPLEGIYRIDRGQAPRRRYKLALPPSSIRFDHVPEPGPSLAGT
jgi:CRISPR-associated protein (TIGR02584 family)